MAKDHNTTIWRTVVFAGAMLGTPTLAVADQPAPPPQQAKMPVQFKDPIQELKTRIDTLDKERQALLAQLAEIDVKEIDKLKKDIATKDAAIKKAVDELVTKRKPRPRTPVVQKPVGRGFVLA